MNVRKKFSLKNRLYLLLLICVIPLTVMITYLLFMINNVSSKYDHIVEKITKANAYNLSLITLTDPTSRLRWWMGY